jgi:hypothetical protein
MASPEYHRRQADLLIKTANATRVSRTAAALKERAMEQIWLAEVAESMAHLDSSMSSSRLVKQMHRCFC